MKQKKKTQQEKIKQKPKEGGEHLPRRMGKEDRGEAGVEIDRSKADKAERRECNRNQV